MLFIDPNRRLRYVPVSEREKPETEQTAFHLRALDARESAEFRDRASATDDTGRTRVRVFVFDIELLRLALTGWEGPDVPPFPEEVTPATVEKALDHLHPSLREELARTAWGLIDVSEDDRKN